MGEPWEMYIARKAHARNCGNPKRENSWKVQLTCWKPCSLKGFFDNVHVRRWPNHQKSLRMWSVWLVEMNTCVCQAQGSMTKMHGSHIDVRGISDLFRNSFISPKLRILVFGVMKINEK